MSREHGWLYAAFAQPGCPVCLLQAEQEQRSLGQLFAEQVTDPEARSRFLAGNGLCGAHAAAALSRHEAVGLSILYESLLGHLEGRLGAAAEALARPAGWQAQGRRQQAAAQLQGAAGCPVCEAGESRAVRALAGVRAAVATPEFREVYSRSEGLCLAHLTRLVGECAGGGALPWLEGALPWLEGAPAADLAWVVAAEQQKLAALRLELAEFLRKQDYRFSHLPDGPERDAYVRSVRKVTGAQPAD